jgi:hypothetical protein
MKAQAGCGKQRSRLSVNEAPDKLASMKRSRVIQAAVALALVVAVALAMVRPEPPPDPVYKGIPLSKWLYMSGMRLHDWEWKKIGAHPQEAIRAIGTNAIPMIVAELSVRDSKLQMWLHDKMEKRDWEGRMPDPAWCRHSDALRACHWLGDKALPVIPVIAELLSEDVHFISRHHAADYLGRLGPKAAIAIPALEAAVRSKALVIWNDRGATNDYAAIALLAIQGERVATTSSISSREPTLALPPPAAD